MLNIVVNGTPQQVPGGITLLEALGQLQVGVRGGQIVGVRPEPRSPLARREAFV